MKTYNCTIANCTNDATHAVEGNHDQGYAARAMHPALIIWASYCEKHAEDVALAFTGVYTEKERDAALDAIEASVVPVQVPEPFVREEDKSWARRFVACLLVREGEATQWFA